MLDKYRKEKLDIVGIIEKGETRHCWNYRERRNSTLLERLRAEILNIVRNIERRNSTLLDKYRKKKLDIVGIIERGETRHCWKCIRETRDWTLSEI